ncbi:tetratricopeptide repeat protein 34 [Syngnathus acus]|uniref:tetratricopeptide repeat protein 34 n=1 Tax=Syngnathus acus TaxID=161584 RepID=UPI0018863E8C|nr:tetratricopeptide repeat protein 34 [Syngnathus acus]XP_037136785.1 tetratricopeptide repeat protein 34 [Syngnathus acus]
MTAMVRPGIKVSVLCEDADKLLEAGELVRATYLYMSAFSTHAGTTVSHMRKMELSDLQGVISILESWLDHPEVQPDEVLSKGLVAVFLSTLCPNNLTATVFKMESLLQSGGQGCEEIFARCTALLERKQKPNPEDICYVALEITRALSCLLSESRRTTGLKLYLKTYKSNKCETVKLVKSRQAAQIPQIVKAVTDQMHHWHPSLMLDSKCEATKKDSMQLNLEAASPLLEFLLELSPDDSHVQELQAAHLFFIGRFRDSADVYSAILEMIQDTPDRRARILTGRAAAFLSAGGRVAEACLDLGQAFEANPACARIYFQKLFTDLGTGWTTCNHLRQQAEKGLSAFRETVLIRADLRSLDGVELLDPVIAQLRTLCHLEPDGGGRELRVRLAECLLLRGEHKEALSICSQLAISKDQNSYQNTVQVLCGYARLLTDDHKGALEDFQAVIEHNAPHPPSCVRALCGRGLLRMTGGFNYLTALDYVTANRLHPLETSLTVRCLVPWNLRGLLLTVLLEQGRVMLEQAGRRQSAACENYSQQAQQDDQLNVTSKPDDHRAGSPAGVHCLAMLLMELQPGTDGPQILAADALYQLGRVEEAYRLLLLSIGHTSPRAPVLARLVLLQLHRGFLYDTNQLLKKLIQCGDTSCLRPLLTVAKQKDRALLQARCHSAAKRLLECTTEESAIREAVAYLSIAIIIADGGAADSLLERGRCYALLGQRKTAIFDFSAILKEQPKHVEALCGRGFTYLLLNQQKECTHDILAALQINTDEVTKDLLSLKDRARKLVSDWLHEFCRSSLSDVLVSNNVPCHEDRLREASVICTALMKTNCAGPRWHLLCVDILLAKGEVEAAGAHLSQMLSQEPRNPSAKARAGVMDAWRHNYCRAARRLCKLAEKESSCLELLLALIPSNQREQVAKAAAQDASSVCSDGSWDQALPLLTLAVQAADKHRLQYLRQRAVCLARLGLHERSVADLDGVIQKHGCSDAGCSNDPQVWAEDLCHRGCSLVLCSREGPALEDYSRALELHKERTFQCVEEGLGKLRVGECFLRGALQHYGEQQLSKAWALIECGLVVDGDNAELRRLRAKVKREVASPCNVN